jgi:hypothetical protein
MISKLKNKDLYIVEPNVPYIRNRLTNEFINLVNNNKSVKIIDKKTKKEKMVKQNIDVYIAIKYQVETDISQDEHESINWHDLSIEETIKYMKKRKDRWFNSKIKS